MAQPLEPTRAAFAHPVARYFAATRPAFLTAALMACLLGLAIAAMLAHGALLSLALILSKGNT